jgi:hypothetical protein
MLAKNVYQRRLKLNIIVMIIKITSRLWYVADPVIIVIPVMMYKLFVKHLEKF